MHQSLKSLLVIFASTALALIISSCESKQEFATELLVNATTGESSKEDNQRLDQLRQEWQKTAANTEDFWLEYGLDQEYGGMFGRLDQDGKPVPEAPKQLSQQTRHLWALSAYYRSTKDQKYKVAADQVFNFLYEKFRIKSGEYSLYTDFKGNKIPTPDRKLRLYMHSFVIFSFAEYAKAFGDSTTLSEALAVFKSLPYDVTYGGYDQSNEARWYEGTKETNSKMHAMEALINLFEQIFAAISLL